MSEELFELNPERIEIALNITKRGLTRRVVHVLRRPSEHDWINYDRGLNITVRDVRLSGEESGTSLDNKGMESACDLWDALKIEAQGYREGEEVMPMHKQAVIDLLLQIYPAPDSAYEGTADDAHEIVILQAWRGNLAFPRLVHKFRRPTAAQDIEYRRAMADSVIIPAKNSKTPQRVILPSRMTRMISLYDALIVGVEGYQIGGVVPSGDADAMCKLIAGFMDAQHKKIAVSTLFMSEDTGPAASEARNETEAEATT